MLKNRIVALLLSLCVLASLCGCKDVSGDEGSLSTAPIDTADGGASDNWQLLYSYSDTLNPYTAGTELNRELCSLLFEPLVRVNNNFENVFCIASSVTLEGKTCTVKLRSVSFSDGSAVTADDVVYSYKAARESKNVYAHRFYEVSGVSASARDTVIFTLTKNDPYFTALLDFPIIKSGSDNIVSSDGVAAVPIGSGRYTVNAERTRLTPNRGYYLFDPSLKDIELINAPDGDAVSHYVEVGASDVYYSSFSGGDIVRMSGKKTDVNLNNLVYIGINSNNSVLSNKYVRYAISSALDREAVCNQAYYNNALAATGFFSPVFKETAARQTLEKNTNLEITIENLNKIGYNRLDNSGYRVNSAGNHLTFTLLVNSDNASRAAAAELISSQLFEAGIEIRVVERPYAEYISALQNGAFQLYLGEVQLQNNMDLSPLVLEGGSAAYGVGKATPAEGEAPDGEDTAESKPGDGENAGEQQSEEEPAISYSEMIARFYAGDAGIGIGDIAGALLTEMPQIPVCYRLGLVFYDSEDVSCENACAGDIYFGMKNAK